jgi:hypothetical protein
MAQALARHQRQAGAGRHDGDALVEADVDDAALEPLHEIDPEWVGVESDFMFDCLIYKVIFFQFF